MSLRNIDRPLVSLAILIACGLVTPLRASDTPPTLLAQQNPAPNAETSAPTTPPGQENRKTSGDNDQSGPSNAAATPDQNKQGDNATHSTPGRAGTEEPGSHAASQDTAVFVNGKLDVAGAPADGQTVPAKFSQRNDALDKLPILGMSLGFSEEQKRAIADTVRKSNAPVIASTAKVSDELPMNVVVQDWPASASDPAFAKLKFVRLPDRILLIEPANRVVIGEIAN
jgi:hypothetical protein